MIHLNLDRSLWNSWTQMIYVFFYRVPLPYGSIKALDNSAIKIVSNVGIFTHSEDRTHLLIEELTDMFRGNGNLIITFCSSISLKYYFFLRSNVELFQLTFLPVNITEDLVKNIKTPALLERNILKTFKINSGDFLFLEWEKFTEDILVTSERSALISSQTSNSSFLLLSPFW